MAVWEIFNHVVKVTIWEIFNDTWETLSKNDIEIVRIVVGRNSDAHPTMSGHV